MAGSGIARLGVTFAGGCNSAVTLRGNGMAICTAIRVGRTSNCCTPMRAVTVPMALGGPATTSVTTDCTFGPTCFGSGALAVLSTAAIGISSCIAGNALGFSTRVGCSSGDVSMGTSNGMALLSAGGVNGSCAVSNMRARILNHQFSVSFTIGFTSSGACRLIIPGTLSMTYRNTGRVGIGCNSLIGGSKFACGCGLAGFTNMLVRTGRVASLGFFTSTSYAGPVATLGVAPSGGGGLAVGSANSGVTGSVAVAMCTRFIMNARAVIGSFGMAMANTLWGLEIVAFDPLLKL